MRREPGTDKAISTVRVKFLVHLRVVLFKPFLAFLYRPSILAVLHGQDVSGVVAWDCSASCHRHMALERHTSGGRVQTERLENQ